MDLAEFNYDSVPGDLAPKSFDFFSEMRATHLAKLKSQTTEAEVLQRINNETTMLSLRKDQNL